MGYLIPPVGPIREVFPQDPAEGFTLLELYELLDTTSFETVEIFDGRKMVINQVKGKMGNLRATVIYQQGRDRTGPALVGNVVLCNAGELL